MSLLPPGVVDGGVTELVGGVVGGLVESDVGGVRSHVGALKVSVSRVTAPVRARARPCTVTPVVTVIEVSARMLPTNTEPVPSVAELPTCQNTLHSWALLISDTVLLDPVISIESVWKMNTVLGSPPPSSTSVPERLSGDLSVPAYTPPGNVRPTRSEVVVALSGRPAALS